MFVQKQLENDADQQCESADELAEYEELTEHISSESYCPVAQPVGTVTGSLIPKVC